MLNTEPPQVTTGIHTPVGNLLISSCPHTGSPCLVHQPAHRSHCLTQNHPRDAVRKWLGGSMLPPYSGQTPLERKWAAWALCDGRKVRALLEQ